MHASAVWSSVAPPKVSQLPRQISLTLNPDAPSRLYCMVLPLLPIVHKPHLFSVAQESLIPQLLHPQRSEADRGPVERVSPWRRALVRRTYLSALELPQRGRRRSRKPVRICRK